MKNNYNKIDLKDRKIIYELDKNARISCAQLGKKIGLSTEVVHYRLKKLEEKGIIAKYHTAIDYFKLKLIHFKICLKYNGIPLDAEEGFYEKLKPINQVIWIARCQGEWDCIISCTVNTIWELDLLKDKIIHLASKYINKKSVSILSKHWSYPRSFLIKGKKEKSFDSKREDIKIDATDLKILRILSKDARKPTVEIAEELNLSLKAISARIKKLIKTKVIRNFRLVIDYDHLGIHFYKTFFYLKDPEEKRVNELLEYLNMHKNVVHNLKVIGDWDLEPEFEFEDPKEFKKTMEDLMNNFSDIIREISIIDIIKEYKYTFFYK